MYPDGYAPETEPMTQAATPLGGIPCLTDPPEGIGPALPNPIR
jgi:hypothetical protein